MQVKHEDSIEFWEYDNLHDWQLLIIVLHAIHF